MASRSIQDQAKWEKAHKESELEKEQLMKFVQKEISLVKTLVEQMKIESSESHDQMTAKSREFLDLEKFEERLQIMKLELKDLWMHQMKEQSGSFSEQLNLLE